jgi:SHS2 domain-containing protein
MPYRVLSHTADTGIEATADSLPALIGDLATGMFGLMAEVAPDSAERWIELRVESSTEEDLAVDALSALLYHSEVEDLLFCAFQVEKEPDALALKVRAGGIPVEVVESSGPPIKAVTYHDLVVEERDGGWYGRMYFDV